MNTSQGLRQFSAAMNQSQLLTARLVNQRSKPVLPASTVTEPSFTPTEGKEHLDELNCPLCFELMTNPRFLECGHTLCQKCLGKWSEQCAMCNKKKPRVRTAPSSLERSILEKVKGDCGSCKRQKISLLEWNRHYTQECSASAAKICNNEGCGEKITNQEEHNKECGHRLVQCICYPLCIWTGKVKDRLKHLLKDCEHYKFAEKVKRCKEDNKKYINQVSNIATAQADLFKTMAVSFSDYCFKYNLQYPLTSIREHLVTSHQVPKDMFLALTFGVSVAFPGILLNGALYNFQDCLLVLVLDQDQLKEYINNQRDSLPEFHLYYKPV